MDTKIEDVKQTEDVKTPLNKEQVFDEKIAPLMRALRDALSEHGIPAIFCAQLTERIGDGMYLCSGFRLMGEMEHSASTQVIHSVVHHLQEVADVNPFSVGSVSIENTPLGAKVTSVKFFVNPGEDTGSESVENSQGDIVH